MNEMQSIDTQDEHMTAGERAARTGQYMAVRASELRGQAKEEANGGDWRETEAGRDAVMYERSAGEWRERADEATKEQMHSPTSAEVSGPSFDPDTEQLVATALEQSEPVSEDAKEAQMEAAWSAHEQRQRPAERQRGRADGWSDAERSVMRHTDELYESLVGEGRRRPSRSQVRRAIRTLGEGMETIYRHEQDGRNWRRSCRAAANELDPAAHEALATLSVAGSDLARSLAKAERKRTGEREQRSRQRGRQRSESKRMDAVFSEIRALRKQRVPRGEIAEALFRLDPAVVLEKLSGELPFGGQLVKAYAVADPKRLRTYELSAAVVVAAAPVGLVRQLRPYVAVARRRVAAGEISEAEALAEMERSGEARRSQRKRQGKPDMDTVSNKELPKPDRERPERVWEFSGPFAASRPSEDGSEASAPEAEGGDELLAAANELGIELSGVGNGDSARPSV